MTRRILVALDGSTASLYALEKVIERRVAGEAAEIHLLNVQIPVRSGHARMFVAHGDLQRYYRDEGLDALAAGCRRLEEAGIPHTHRVAVGSVAKTIAEFAAEHGFDEVVVGAHRREGIADLLFGSVAADLVDQSNVPVTLIDVDRSAAAR